MLGLEEVRLNNLMIGRFKMYNFFQKNVYLFFKIVEIFQSNNEYIDN